MGHDLDDEELKATRRMKQMKKFIRIIEDLMCYIMVEGTFTILFLAIIEKLS